MASISHFLLTHLSNEVKLRWARDKIKCILKKVDGLTKKNLENPDGIKKAITNVPKAGTPGFAPPEIFTGEVYQNSDLYSLGKTIIFVAFEWDFAFELLYGPVEHVREDPRNFKREYAIKKFFEKFKFLELVKVSFICN